MTGHYFPSNIQKQSTRTVSYVENLESAALQETIKSKQPQPLYL